MASAICAPAAHQERVTPKVGYAKRGEECPRGERVTAKAERVPLRSGWRGIAGAGNAKSGDLSSAKYERVPPKLERVPPKVERVTAKVEDLSEACRVVVQERLDRLVRRRRPAPHVIELINPSRKHLIAG